MSHWVRWCCISLAVITSAAAYGSAEQAPEFIRRVEFDGNRRVSSEAVQALIFTRPGDPYCQRCLQGDLQELQRNPNFENARLEVRDVPDNKNAKIAIFHFDERLVIRRIEYRGLKSLTKSDVLGRFKDHNVNLLDEGLFDQAETAKAELVIRELLIERGLRAATVTSAYEQIPGTNAVSIRFESMGTAGRSPSRGRRPTDRRF